MKATVTGLDNLQINIDKIKEEIVQDTFKTILQRVKDKIDSCDNESYKRLEKQLRMEVNGTEGTLSVAEESKEADDFMAFLDKLIDEESEQL